MSFSFVTPQQAERPYTVSEINEGISLIIEQGNALVWVEGEIADWRVSSNGHCYFRLADSESRIPAVLWRQVFEKLSFTPENGLAVVAIATIRVYRKAGYYQLDCHRMEPIGRGALQLAFEQLAKKLDAEGLFDPAHKIPLPLSVRRLGVVTSKSGAALHDIVRVVASRAPQTDIVLCDVPVQGEGAAPRIAAAIRRFNEWGGVDCIIAGRGGGSAEDLWAWNDEAIARAIYESEIAIISAIGHEIDYTIADFVADVRAPTPSAAAEMAVPDRTESRNYFDACAGRFARAAGVTLAAFRERFEAAGEHYGLRRPVELLLDGQQQFDGAVDRCVRAFCAVAENRTVRFSALSSRLNALSPLAVLSRGYSVVTTEAGAPVRDAAALSPGQTVAMRFSRGKATAAVTGIEAGPGP